MPYPASPPAKATAERRQDRKVASQTCRRIIAFAIAIGLFPPVAIEMAEMFDDHAFAMLGSLHESAFYVR